MRRAIRRVMIKGRVQGVGFRAWVDHEARRLGLHGWVRNRREGSVEAVFDGDEKTVAEMIAACRKGPSSSRVDDVAVETANEDVLGLRYSGEAFSVLQTI